MRHVVVRSGRAVAVRTAAGAEIPARGTVLAAVSALNLYGGLVGWEHLRTRPRDDLRRFQWDYSTFKVDSALRAPVPWQAPGVAGAGTVQVAASLDEMSQYAMHISSPPGRYPPARSYWPGR